MLTKIIDNDAHVKGIVGHASLEYKSGSVLFVRSGQLVELFELESEIEDIDKLMQNYTEKEMINEWNKLKKNQRDQIITEVNNMQWLAKWFKNHAM